MKPIQTGLIGFGFSGSTFHAPVIQAVPALKLTKVLSSKPEVVKQSLPEAEITGTLEEMLNDPELELVIITSPNETHYPYAKEALAAGKHVVVEKPFVIRIEEADELIQLARKQNRILSVYQNRRFDSDFLTVQKCLSQELIGTVHTYHAHFHRFRPQVKDRWREWDLPGSGLLYDLGSHLVDQALVLFGLPQFVSAELFKQRPQAQTTDAFHLVLGYESGLRVRLEAGCLVKSPGPRYEIHGRQGTLIKYGMDPQEEQLKNGLTPHAPEWGKERPEHYLKAVYEKDGLEISATIPSLAGCYEMYYQKLAEAIRTGSRPPVTAEEARETIRIIEAVIQSHREGRRIDL